MTIFKQKKEEVDRVDDFSLKIIEVKNLVVQNYHVRNKMKF